MIAVPAAPVLALDVHFAASVLDGELAYSADPRWSMDRTCMRSFLARKLVAERGAVQLYRAKVISVAPLDEDCAALDAIRVADRALFVGVTAFGIPLRLGGLKLRHRDVLKSAAYFRGQSGWGDAVAPMLAQLGPAELIRDPLGLGL